jgi:hypothetical protein
LQICSTAWSIALRPVENQSSAGRGQRHGRIEDHRTRREHWMGVAFLGLLAAVGDAGEGRELGGGERGRDGRHPHTGGDVGDARGPVRGRRDRDRALRPCQAGPEAKLHDLGRIDGRTAAERHQQVGLRRRAASAPAITPSRGECA